jgi:signal transduction histidine kinase
MLPIKVMVKVMGNFSATIERGFYKTIQWGLKHQLRAVIVVILAVAIPFGALNAFQYQAMTQYESEGTKAVQEQLQYLLGNFVLKMYKSERERLSDGLHTQDNKHVAFLTEKPEIQQQTIDTAQKDFDDCTGCTADMKKPEREIVFSLTHFKNQRWQQHFPTNVKPNLRQLSALAKASRWFFSLSPEKRDVGYLNFYDETNEQLIHLHPISPNPISYELNAPPRKIKAVLGTLVSKEMIKMDLLKGLGKRRVQKSRYSHIPFDRLLTSADYYFQVQDEKGQTLYEDPEWKQSANSNWSLSSTFLITPEQTYLTNWKVSIITCNVLKKATNRAVSQMLIVSSIVAMLICVLLIILLKAGLAAVKISQMQTDIVAGVSHDLKTPLAGISASAQLLASGRADQPEEVKEFSGYILNEAKRLTAVVEKVLTLAKLETKQLPMRPEAISIVCLVDQVIESVSSAFPEATIVRGNVPDDNVSGDFQGLTTVLINLIDNAVRYSDADIPWVQIDAEWNALGEKRDLHLRVRDRGVGIPVEEQSYIFQKFYRVRHGMVCNTEGTGLGLAIASEIIRAHHGSIQVESRPGLGSVFTVVLPYERPNFSH